MLLEENHLITVGTRTIKHYQNLGYDCKFKDKIIVPTKHLTQNSMTKVSVVCDYCGETYNPTYSSYNKNKKKTIIDKDCCKKCRQLKSKEVAMKAYGVPHSSHLESTKEKRKNTLLEKYGVDNIMKLPETIDKIKSTCIERYGEDNYCKTDISKTRHKETCLERYGVDNPSKLDEFKQKKIETSIKHYGTNSPMQDANVKSKCLKNRNITLYKNGTVATSSQQIEVFNILNNLGYNVEINYPEDKFSLDTALFTKDIKINIEYDGWYWHQDVKKDIIRNKILINKFGWKVLRIKSSNLIPTNEQLIDAIESLINTDSVYTEIVLDDWKLASF